MNYFLKVLKCLAYIKQEIMVAGEKESLERIGEHWHDFDPSLLSQLHLSRETDMLLVWDDKPEKGNMSVYLGSTGVEFAFGDWGDGDEWTHHYQPDGFDTYSPENAIRFVRKYAQGMLLALNWFERIDYFMKTTGFNTRPAVINGVTKKEMWLFRQKILGDTNVTLQKITKNNGVERFLYQMQVDSMLRDKSLQAKLFKIASR